MTASCPKKPNIAEISPHLICALCGGYLIDATTIVECLHSFCKTCIVRYLESSKYCPICEVLVHKTRPLQNIRLDHTLQDIVYKLVPGLFQTEMQRRRDFYKDSPTIRSAKSRQEQQRHRVIYSADEKFSLALEFCPEGKVRKRSARRSRSSPKEAPDRRYFLCPASATIALLKKFIKLKFTLPDNYKVDVFHAQGSLHDHFSLMDIAYIHSWRREGVLHLYYFIYKEPDPVPKIEVTEVKQEEVKHEEHEDNRPSSLFTKAKLLGNHSVDGSIPHNLSPLELIATVANDISIQEGRGLKRKTDVAQLYEQDEENSDEIQIRKSIEHAIDICSNNSNTAETKPAATTALDHTKSPMKVSVSFSSLDTPQAQAKSLLPALLPGTVQTKAKAKEKPKTTDTASQCDPRPKKHKTEASSIASISHSRSPVKNARPENIAKDVAKNVRLDNTTKDVSKSARSENIAKDIFKTTRPDNTAKDVTKNTRPDNTVKDITKNTRAESTTKDVAKNVRPDNTTKDVTKNTRPDYTTKDVAKNTRPDNTAKDVTKNSRPDNTTKDIAKSSRPDNTTKDVAKNSSTDHTTKDVARIDTSHALDKARSKSVATAKPDRVKTNGNNNMDHVTAVTKPHEKIVRDSNANQTIVTGRQIQEQVEKTAMAIAAAQKANAAKTDTASSLAQINGLTSTTDVAKQHLNHASAKTKQHVDGKE